MQIQIFESYIVQQIWNMTKKPKIEKKSTKQKRLTSKGQNWTMDTVHWKKTSPPLE